MALPTPTDLRSITRRSDSLLTTVTLYPNERDDRLRIEWLTFGEAEIRTFEHKLTSWLTGHLRDATDFEHDSAFALRLPLVGLTFRALYRHVSSFTAWVAPGEPDDFHVPRAGYDPAKMKDAQVCKDKGCDEKHMIVPEGFYVPPFDPELYDAVRGKRVEISVGPVALAH